MRGKGVVAGLVAAVVITAGVVALGVGPGEPEPDFGQASERERSDLESALASASESESESASASESESESGAESASASAAESASASESESASASESESERESESDALSCVHPFVPSQAGSWRRYSWRQSAQEQVATLRIEAIGARDVASGEREITWRVEVTASDDAELASEEMRTRCVPAQAAEEPWFGILERSLRLQPTGAPRWRWPARLERGLRFEGVATFDTSGAEMRAPEGADGPMHLRVTRRHVVAAREAVEVAAGSWRAWRVDYEEEHAFGERGERGTGTVWVAPGIGMIKSTSENSRGVRQTIELVAFGD